MRQRKIKDIDGKLEAYRHLIVSVDDLLGGDSIPKEAGDTSHEGEVASDRSCPAPLGDIPLFVELGCGRGRFINELALRHPQDFFIGIEGNTSIAYRGMQKTEALGLSNVRYIPAYISDAREAFAANSVSGIYLNFSDPWPKERHEKRRLTAPPQIEAYKSVLTSGGFIALKTDNIDFFEYSQEKFREADLQITGITRDLHDSAYAVDNVMTEYEKKFAALGKKICYLKAMR